MSIDFMLLVGWVICTVIGAYVGESKGRTGEGVVLGFLFGPLGVLAIVGFPDKRDQAIQNQMAVTLSRILVELQSLNKAISVEAEAAPQPEPPPQQKPEPQLDQFVPDNLVRG